MTTNPQPSTEGQTLRDHANQMRESADFMHGESRDLVLAAAVAFEKGADALDKLSSPDYIVVPRAQAEKALEEAFGAGRDAENALRASHQRHMASYKRASAEGMKEARTLLTLEEA